MRRRGGFATTQGCRWGVSWFLGFSLLRGSCFGWCVLLGPAGRGLPGGKSILATPLAGSRPGGRRTFLCFAKEKYAKERRPAVWVPPLRCGQPALLDHGGGLAKLATLRFAQTTPALIPPPSALLGPARTGKSEIPNTGRQIQIPNPNTKQGHAMACPCGFRYFGVLSSAVWLFDCLVFRVPLWMRRGAQVQADQGSRCLSEAQRSEFSETPPEPSTAGCPVAKRRGRSNQGRLFFGDFLLAKQKKVTCRRATPGQQNSKE